MRQVLSTVKRDASGKVASMRQTVEMKETSGTVDGDNNGFVNIPLAAKEIEAVVYMREVEPDFFRVSLRSKDGVNVARVAEKFGGGGHKNAAGCRVKGNWDEMEKEIVAAVAEAVEKSREDSAKTKDELELILV
jgi:phosphoesterase RecJ-like protein